MNTGSGRCTCMAQGTQPSPEDRGVRYAKSLSIRYFIDINILQNSLINIDIDIFKNGHIDIDIDIDIFQIVLIDIDIDIDIFQISLSIFLSISIFSKFSYRYFFDINILKMSVNISPIFQKKADISTINIDISQNSLCEIDILQNFLSGIDINIDIFQNFLSEIDISQIPLAISILIFSKISLAEKNMVFVRSV